jgi:hypothetical protein
MDARHYRNRCLSFIKMALAHAEAAKMPHVIIPRPPQGGHHRQNRARCPNLDSQTLAIHVECS